MFVCCIIVNLVVWVIFVAWDVTVRMKLRCSSKASSFLLQLVVWDLSVKMKPQYSSEAYSYAILFCSHDSAFVCWHFLMQPIEAAELGLSLV
ncbi:hypothetical protein Hanom_Chr03g00251991 [Helianthus anomalus]